MNAIRQFYILIERSINPQFNIEFTSDAVCVLIHKRTYREVQDTIWMATYTSLNHAMFDLLYEL